MFWESLASFIGRKNVEIQTTSKAFWEMEDLHSVTGADDMLFEKGYIYPSREGLMPKMLLETRW